MTPAGLAAAKRVPPTSPVRRREYFPYWLKGALRAQLGWWAGAPRWGPALRALRALRAPHRTPTHRPSTTKAPRTGSEAPHHRAADPPLSIRPTPGRIKGAHASLRDGLRPPLTRPSIGLLCSAMGRWLSLFDTDHHDVCPMCPPDP
ncbi:hypothetical protein CAE01nite_26790 [Cellulomonas aerilata]|uniref:Uncharacterized protein n=1 Tax=Cellulomonas aerilata TaxID=515326 RepID=A0A512DEP6_9CELL|nr:hypothetical protein CAE01nite_26790 [Cellulomonas aerilata]